MEKINVRELVGYSESEIWGIENIGHVIAVFDDGEEVQTNGRYLIYSWYCWIFHSKYPELPMTSRYLLKGQVNKRSHLELKERAMFDLRDICVERGLPIEMEVWSRWVFEAFDELFTASKEKLDRYVGTISALDFVDVLHHPKIYEVNTKLQTMARVKESDITNTHAVVRKVLMDPNELPTNGVAKAVRAGMVDIRQTIQCVSARGKVTDISSDVFDETIRRGFAHGVRRLSDAMMESRTAAKSLYFSDDPMRKSEYFNRTAQLSTETVCKLHAGDCGSRDYLPITVNTQNLLRDMVGIHYLDPESNKLRVIKITDSHLVGSVVKIRSAFTCKHPDRYGICTTCFGELGYSVPARTSIGFVCSFDLLSTVTQLLLSNKHLDASAHVDDFFISDVDAPYISYGSEENTLCLNENLARKKLTLQFPAKEAKNILDVRSAPDLDALNTQSLSGISYMTFIVADDNMEVRNTIRVETGATKGVLTRDMLLYICSHGCSMDNRGNYLVDMTDWDYARAFIELPPKHFSTLAYMQSIERFIKGGKTKNRTSLMSFNHPMAALTTLHELVSQKLSCHLSHLQVIILGNLVADREKRDFHLPLERVTGQPATYRQIMKLRSLGAAMAYQGQEGIILALESFLIKKRPRHPLDAMLLG